MKFATWEKVSFGLLIGAWAVFVPHILGDFLVHADPLDKPAYAVAAQEAAAAKPADGGAVENALTLLAAAAPEKGAKLFKKCKSCHTVDKGGKNTVGPNLWDVVGRAKAGGAGFSYSGALKDKGGDWSYADLDAFIANPKDYAKGTKMSFAGLKKAGDRAAMLLYLRSLSDSPKPLP